MSSMSEEQEKLLAELFMGQFHDRYHNPRMDKARSLFALAGEVKSGAIVELGTYHGCGAISLAWGALGLPVITIDDYTEKKGWIGEPYGPKDRGIFRESIARAGVTIQITLFDMDVDKVSDWWLTVRNDIGLL